MDDEVGVMNQLKIKNLISYPKLACFPYIAKKAVPYTNMAAVKSYYS